MEQFDLPIIATNDNKKKLYNDKQCTKVPIIVVYFNAY